MSRKPEDQFETPVATFANPANQTSSQIIETHISKVILTDQYVYKLKKPVKFPFCDYSSFKLRLGAVKNELDLNRRLTTKVYLGCTLLGPSPCSYLQLIDTDLTELKGDDAAVVMRRLDNHKFLDHLVTADDPQLPTLIEQVADKLAAFHSNHRISPSESEVEHAITLIRSNFTELKDQVIEPDDGLLDAVNSCQDFVAAELERYSSSVAQRIQLGWYADGHGDLRLEHICIEASETGNTIIQIFDCLEFNSALRCGDVLADIAFLAMDLDLNYRSDLSAALISHYLHNWNKFKGPETGDLLKPLSLFKVYRAAVRAKVHLLRSKQLVGPERTIQISLSKRYLALAQRYIQPRQPFLALVCGISGSGKSTLAQALSLLTGAELLSTDIIRRELFNETSGKSNEQYNCGIYSEEGRTKIYNLMLERAESLLEQGIPVIVDGTFLSTNLRMPFRLLTERTKTVSCFIECEISAEEAASRIQQRALSGQTVSNAQPQHLTNQTSQLESLRDNEATLIFRLSVKKPVDLLASKLAQHLATLNH